MKSLIKGLAACVALAASVPVTAQDKTCDRDCLMQLADRYVAALVAHDPAKLPLAGTLRTVENLKRIKPGEGLWSTLTGGPEHFVIRVPDPVSQQVGIMALVKGEEGKPALIGVRLKLDMGRIVEAEHMVANAIGDAQLANLQAVPPNMPKAVEEQYADSRGRLIFIGQSYYRALDNNNGSQAPFADDCIRFENGFQTARNSPARTVTPANGDPSFAALGALGCEAQMDTNMWEYIDEIANRRVEIADPVTGLVWGMSHFHHDMKEKELPVYGIPGAEMRDLSRFKAFDMPAIHIYKIWGGEIHEIEAMGFTTGYMSPTGWEE